jgi:hypothetical protein
MDSAVGSGLHEGDEVSEVCTPLIEGAVTANLQTFAPARATFWRGRVDPPWRKYPEIPALSIGWRMGYGQDYYLDFYKWFYFLPDEEKAAYIQANPLPQGWPDIYEVIIENPWNPAWDAPSEPIDVQEFLDWWNATQ